MKHSSLDTYSLSLRHSLCRSMLCRGMVAVLLGGALLCGVAPSALAADGKDFSMRPWVAAQLTEARDEINEKKYAAALETLSSARDRGKLTPHEEAMVTQTEGYVYSAKSDYKRAAQQFEKSLATDAVPDQAVVEMHYNLGQLYQIEKEYKKAIIHLLRWVSKAKSPKGNDLYMIATVYVQAGSNSKALKWGRRAIATSSKPKEGWLQLVASLLFEKKRYKELPEVLEPLASMYPKKVYYDQLFAVYVKTGQANLGLGLLEMAYRQGFLEKSDEIQNLAIMYLQRGVPLKGAAVLEQAMKDGTVARDFKAQQLLAECLLSAKELNRALDPLDKAAKVAPKGDLYMRIAEIHVTFRRWAKARDAINKALAKGKLADSGSAYLLLGIANYRDQKSGPASVAFNRAKKHKSVRKQAEQWLTLLKSNAEG